MAKIELKQKVKRFESENTEVEQEVLLEDCDSELWVHIMHDGYEMNLSLQNFKKLNELVDNAISIYNEHVQD